MKILLFTIHFIITALFIAGITISQSKSDGMGALGGSSHTFKATAGGIEALLEKWLRVLAWVFLASCVVSAFFVGKFF